MYSTFRKLISNYQNELEIENINNKELFLFDDERMILPAYGTYTGGLNWDAAPLKSLMKPTAAAILTGKKLFHIPSLATLSNSGR